MLKFFLLLTGLAVTLTGVLTFLTALAYRAMDGSGLAAVCGVLLVFLGSIPLVKFWRLVNLNPKNAREKAYY
ncbi:MAG: hypothetical protein LBP95_05915 [Deltaproteobacteria bacterium]|jgi:uncharacterized membrane protein HdeD (DUF308 family)|nr:hypothetical protein [Deltaproteobacteria bacterium]